MSRVLIDSIGIEIEFANIVKTRGDTFRRNETRWRLVEDGSCRSHRNVLPGVDIEVAGNGQTAMFGGEFISPIINTTAEQNWKDEIARILDWIAESGEGLDVRTSIHVHVNVGSIPLFAVKNILRLGLYLEAGIYRLACAEMGVHRGALHLDYGYCRPISEMGPPIVRDSDDDMRPVFSTKRLLRLKSLDHLRKGLGRYDTHGGSKYHEARYVWLNLISLYQYGSIEFRLFNSTLAYRNVVAWVDLCQHIIRTGFAPLDDLPEYPLGSTDIELQDIIELLGLKESKTVYTLERLWSQADYQRGVMGYQIGHLGSGINWHRAPRYLVPPIIKGQIYPFREFSLGGRPTPITRGWLTIRS